MKTFTVANVQMMVHKDKAENLKTAEKWIKEVEGVDFVLLPEMFNCPYLAKNFPIYAEDEEDSETLAFCSELSKKYKLYLVAGSIPEKDKEGCVYNTAYAFNREGEIIGKARKTHLFDIAVTGGQVYRESDTLTPGDKIETFETEFGIMGLCICYDYRFPEMGRIMAQRGAVAVFCPAAFNMTTGPAHWEILHRCRSLDNQLFSISTAPARDASSGYTSWGHSLVVDPWGAIINMMDEKEGVQVTTCDLARLHQVREELPLLQHRRLDMYEIFEKNK